MEGFAVMSDESGYTIGIAELYNEIRQLSEKMTEYIGRHSVVSATQEHKIAELSRDLEEFRGKLETEKTQRDALGKQFWFSLLSSLILPIIVMVVGGMIIAKGG